jgi:RNA polymerase sigma-70 factor (ECF subfamily)
MATSIYPVLSLASTRIHDSGSRPSQAQVRRSQADAVSRAQAGNEDAFSEVYVHHKKRVFSICIRIVRDFALAEDLTQETFLQVHRKLESFRGDSAFTTWLHRLTVNTVLMHLRKRAMPVISLDQLTANVPEEHLGRGFGTLDLAQAGAVDRLAIDRAVATLTPGYRVIFILHDVEGFDHSEIAAMLKCTCGSTRFQLCKAREALRSALSAEAGCAGGDWPSRANASTPLRNQTRKGKISTKSARPASLRA